jgi:regulatory protein
VNLLSRREHGRAELCRKLLTREHPRDEVEQALDRLEELGLLDDQRAAQSLARYWATQRRHGPMKLRASLREKGFSASLIERAIESVELDWTEQARDLAASRGLDLGEDKQRQKLLRFLVGRGYSMSLAILTLESLRDEG